MREIFFIFNRVAVNVCEHLKFFTCYEILGHAADDDIHHAPHFH